MKRFFILFLVAVIIAISCAPLCSAFSAYELTPMDYKPILEDDALSAMFNSSYSSVLPNENLMIAYNNNIVNGQSYPLDIETTIGLPITTAISYINDFTDEQKQLIKEQFEADISQFETSYNIDINIEEINATVTNTYNCHAYAWYNAPDNGLCWIKDPCDFFRDPHCLYISPDINSDNVQEGDIVYFHSYSEGAIHSSIIDSITYVNGQRKIRLRSKFDVRGLYIHDFEETQYFYSYHTYYVYRYVQDEHITEYSSISDYYHCKGCEKCDQAEFFQHNKSCITVSSSQHRYICSDCDYNKTESHTPEYTVYSEEEHKARCSGCGYTVFEGHDLYVSDTHNDIYTIECRECSYSFNCNCDREYVPNGSAGHYIDCIEGCFSEFESHTYELTGEYDNYCHEIECIYCGYSDYIDHDLYMYFEDVGEYVVKCHDCTYTVECWEEPDYYGDSEDGHWVDCPCGCYSFFEPHTPGNYYNTEEGYHEIECADCGYLYTEDCSYGSAETGNSSYHYYECTDCGYEHYEYHVFTYSQIANNNFVHNAYCRICQATYEKPHNWVSASGGYRCTDCNMRTTILPNYSSMSNEDLELLLSSMSEEELEAFIALLPEDAVARVTAILPPDDEHLTE